jgi:hypothetical protein
MRHYVRSRFQSVRPKGSCLMPLIALTGLSACTHVGQLSREGKDAFWIAAVAANPAPDEVSNAVVVDAQPFEIP